MEQVIEDEYRNWFSGLDVILQNPEEKGGRYTYMYNLKATEVHYEYWRQRAASVGVELTPYTVFAIPFAKTGGPIMICPDFRNDINANTWNRL